MFSVTLLFHTTLITAMVTHNVYSADQQITAVQSPSLFSILYQTKCRFKKDESFTISLTKAEKSETLKKYMQSDIGCTKKNRLQWIDPEHNYDNFVQLKAFFAFIGTQNLTNQEIILAVHMIAKNRFDECPQSFHNRVGYFYGNDNHPSIEHRIPLLQKNYIDALNTKNKKLIALYGMALYSTGTSLTHLQKPINHLLRQ